jgi:hypothetical protein
MLEKLFESLCNELSVVPDPEAIKTGTYRISLKDSIELLFSDLKPGVSISSHIAACPTKNREDFFIWIMRANLLGQGTGKCRIGLDSEEKLLTLSLGLPYEMNYSTFREKVEDFINYIVYWREEIAQFGKKG